MPVAAIDATRVDPRVDTRVWACPCGAMVPVRRRMVAMLPDDADIAIRMRAAGPFEGECPQCGRTAQASGAWLEIDSLSRHAALVVPGDRRGDIVELLQEHLAWIARHPELVQPWTLQPEVTFVVPGEETARRAVREDSSATRAVPRPTRAAEPARPTSPLPEPGTPIPIIAGVPQPIAGDGAGNVGRRPSLGAWVGDLHPGDDAPVVMFMPDDERGEKWRDAKLEARPLHLRNRGYPLLGVRIVASWMGQVGCLDAFVDVGQPQSQAIFRMLSQRFAMRVVATLGAGEQIVREVVVPGLEPNAALCLESAHGALSSGDNPPEQFRIAVESVAADGVEERLAQTKVTIAPGSYLHIIGARDAMRALEHIDRVSRKETLARLLEVEGLPMAEYDAIRRRVLSGAVEHGIVAPRRFWRRVVASGLADDLNDYVQKLARNREIHEGEEGDLEPEAARAAWQAILDVCDRKDLAVPEPLRRALDLPEQAPRDRSQPRATAGVIDVVDATGDAGAVAGLVDVRTRLRTATALLQNPRTTARELEHLFEALERFDQDELLAILPDLSDLGPRAVAGMVDKLRSPRRELRQAASILLGMSLDPDALGPLSDALVVETTNVWLDIARALGGFGPIALRRLCQLLRREAGSPREQATIERVARALAEIALSDGPSHGDSARFNTEGARGNADGATPGHDAVSALADAPDPRVSAAARRALATLRDVSESGAAIRGELPLTEVTEIRGFSRRAYEAIMVPELEVEADG